MSGVFKRGHVVKTAHGARYRLGYVDGTKADAIQLDERGHENQATRTVLTLSDVTRVTDPARQLPPIEGLPTDRPRCPGCDRLLAPITDAKRDEHFRVTRRIFMRWDCYAGNFCALRCAHSFALAALKAGYRIAR